MPKKKASKIGVDKSSSNNNYRVKKILATVILIGLIGFIAYALSPFINAFLGALVIYFLFRPFYLWMNKKKKISKYLSASIILLLVLLIIVIPLGFGSSLLINEVTALSVNKTMIIDKIDGVDALFPNVNLSSMVQTQLSDLSSFAKNIVISAVSNFVSFLINIVILFFVLFYLLLEGDVVAKKIKKYLPFNSKNSKLLVEEFKKITNSTVFATGVIGVLQGILMALAFYLFGIQSPILWGFISMIFAMLPVIGIPFVWLPAALFLGFVDGRVGAAIGLSVWGLIITNIDYVWWRPWIQRKTGKLHPLITLIGIFMGIPIFGILGLVVGPMLLSFVLLISKMYVEEYLSIPLPSKKIITKKK